MDSQEEQLAAASLLILIAVMIAFVAQDTEKIAYEKADEYIESN